MRRISCSQPPINKLRALRANTAPALALVIRCVTLHDFFFDRVTYATNKPRAFHTSYVLLVLVHVSLIMAEGSAKSDTWKLWERSGKSDL